MVTGNATLSELKEALRHAEGRLLSVGILNAAGGWQWAVKRLRQKSKTCASV